MNIGYVYVCRKTEEDDYKNIIGKRTDNLLVDVLSRQQLKTIFKASKKGTILTIESITHLGDNFTQIHQFCKGWIETGRIIHVIDKRLTIKRPSDIDWLKELRDNEESLTERRAYKFKVQESARTCRTRRGKLSVSQIKSIISKRKNGGTYAGKSWTFALLGEFYGVNEKTVRNSVKKYEGIKFKKSGLITV